MQIQIAFSDYFNAHMLDFMHERFIGVRIGITYLFIKTVAPDCKQSTTFTSNTQAFFNEHAHDDGFMHEQFIRVRSGKFHFTQCSSDWVRDSRRDRRTWCVRGQFAIAINDNKGDKPPSSVRHLYWVHDSVHGHQRCRTIGSLSPKEGVIIGSNPPEQTIHYTALHYPPSASLFIPCASPISLTGHGFPTSHWFTLNMLAWVDLAAKPPGMSATHFIIPHVNFKQSDWSIDRLTFLNVTRQCLTAVTFCCRNVTFGIIK